MKREPKLRGSKDGKVSALTQLKELALKKPEVRAEIWEWRSEAGVTNAAVRGRIEARFGFQLSWDSQVSELWSWLGGVIREERFNERVEQFEDWYRTKSPGKTAEQVREAGIAFFMTEAMAEENREGFLEVVDRDLKNVGMKSKAQFEERKVSVSERRMSLLEKKADQADKAKAITASEATAEEKAARMKELFGMG